MSRGNSDPPGARPTGSHGPKIQGGGGRLATNEGFKRGACAGGVDRLRRYL